MKTIYDIQQILKRFGTFIYTGDRLGDIELMTLELKELYETGFIQQNEFQMARLILRKEERYLNEIHKNKKKDG